MPLNKPAFRHYQVAIGLFAFDPIKHDGFDLSTVDVS